MGDDSSDSVVMAFIGFTSRYGYPKYVLPDAGSQLITSCEDMRYSFIDIKHRLFNEYGVDFRTCPVGAHYTHGKVERKTREAKNLSKLMCKIRDFLSFSGKHSCIRSPIV